MGGPSSTRRARVLVGGAIIFFALVSAYLGLVIITRVDTIFFPGNQVTFPGGKFLPGIDAAGESGSKARINILVMGLDRRPTEGDIPTRTDTLFVLTVDPRTKSSAILGFPRDLLVDIPGKSGGTYQDRINTVYENGELASYPGGGVAMLKDVMQRQFQIKIDKYVIIDFTGFKRVIDGLGGIDVDVPDEVSDPQYSESELPGDFNPQHFYPGRQHMDGSTALAYSRIRFSSDDLDRIQRQERVIFAVIDRAKSLDVLGSAPSLWSKYQDTIKTDISDAQIPGYALLANQVKDSLNAVSLGPATSPYTTPQGASVLLGNKQAIARIVESLFSDKTSTSTPPRPVKVQVQNGTSSDGLAGRVVRFLAGKGYTVDDLNATDVPDAVPRPRSEVIDVDGSHAANTRTIAAWLKIPETQVRNATPDEAASLKHGEAILLVLGDDVDFNGLLNAAANSDDGGGGAR